MQLIDGRYRLIREIGRGGTSVIYLAEDINLRIQVVLKQLGINPANLEEGRNEVDLLKKLHHSNLPQVYNYLNYNGRVYTVVAYIQGHDLTAYLPAGGRRSQIPEETLRSWLWQLCDALAYLHSRTPGIIHSDIKPGNIMITPEGRAMLIDFNISLLTGGDVKGYSNWYASPEQLQMVYAAQQGRSNGRVCLDARSDIYSLAATFYHLISGRAPAMGRQNPPLSSMKLPYSSGLLAILDRAMAVQPGKRFQSAKQMKSALMNMRWYDRRFRHQLGGQLALAAVSLALITGGVLSIYFGNAKNLRGDYQTLYAAVVEAYEEQSWEEAIQAGFAYLDAEGLDGIRDSNPEELAQVYQAIGEGYYLQGEYQSAAAYYQKALEAEESKIRALRYVVSLARLSQISQAEEAMEQYRQVLSAQSVTVIQTELACQRGDYQQALSLVEAADLSGYDEQEQAALYAAGAQAAVKLGLYETAVEYLQQCYVWTDSSYYLQLKAEACYNAAVVAAAAGDAETAGEWYTQSLNAYRLLNAYTPLVENEIWEAVVEYKLGQYISARDHLLSLTNSTQDSAELYRIYMYLAFVCADEGSAGDALIESYCNQAILYYNQTSSNQRQERTSLDIVHLEKLALQYGCQRTLEG